MKHFLRHSLGLHSQDQMMIFIVLFVLFAITLLVLHIFFFITAQKAMENVSPDLRKMQPEQVWLMLIPLFNYIWLFIMVTNIADSLDAEFRRRNVRVMEDRPGFGLGMTYAFLLFVTFLISFLDVLALTSLLFAAVTICWALYWAKINAYRRQLEQSGHWQNFMRNTQLPPFPPPPFPLQYNTAPYQNFPPPVYPVVPPHPQFPPPPFPAQQFPQQFPPQPPPHPDDFSRWMRPEDKPKEE